MGPIRARLISKSLDGQRAEVVACLGDGPNKRYVTMHVWLGRDGRWTGPHPDKAEIARLDVAEKDEDRSKRMLTVCEKMLVAAAAAAEVSLLLLKERKAEMVLADYYAQLNALESERDIRSGQRDLALKFVGEARKAADEVRAEVARMPEFVF